MLLTPYPVIASDDRLAFEFESIGPKGRFMKLVEYAPVSRNFYALGFGDRDPFTGFLDDLSVSDNGDMKRILTTIVSTIYSFTEFYPSTSIYATGSTASRTRLYRIEISNHLPLIEKDFLVFGSSNLCWETFQKNRDYEAFAVRRRL